MRYLLCILSAVVFLCCQQQTAEQPSLPDEKLARIMADISIAEAATNGLSGYPKDSLMKAYFTQVFEIHGTTQEAYEKDLRLVSTDLPRLQQIVLESIKLLGGNDIKQDKPLE